MVDHQKEDVDALYKEPMFSIDKAFTSYPQGK